MPQVLFLLSLAALIAAGVWRRKTALGVAILAGLISGFVVSGAGGRSVMRIIAIADPIPTRFTIGGTLFLLLGMGAFGAIFGGAGGIIFVGIRKWLPVPGRWKGLAFGALLLLATGGLFFSTGQDENFSDFRPPLLGVSLFAGLYLLYGLGVGAGVERYHKYGPTAPRNQTIMLIGYAVVAALCVIGLYSNAQAIRTILATAAH